MSEKKAASEAEALAIALESFRRKHPATDPINSSVGATSTATARGVPSSKQYAVEIQYMGFDFRKREPKMRAAHYLIDAASA